jgi:hypothetical protein
MDKKKINNIRFFIYQNTRDQKILEEKRRQELLNSSVINETPEHVQLFLDNDQNEIRHHNRLTRTNNGMYNML